MASKTTVLAFRMMITATLASLPSLAIAQDADSTSLPPLGTTSSRLSLPSLLSSLPLLPLGLYFLLLGRRIPLLTAALSLANAFALAAWAGTVNLQDQGGITGTASSDMSKAMAVWGIMAGFWVLGCLLAISRRRYGLYAGWVSLGAEGGLALGFSFMLIGNNMTIHSLAWRWVVIAFFLLVFVFVLVTLDRGVILATSAVGSFLLLLGVDLLVNVQHGMSKGLGFLLDHPDKHPAGLESYIPSASTRALAACVYLLTLLGALFQYITFPHATPFLDTPTSRALSATVSPHTSSPNRKDPDLESGLYRQTSTTPGSGGGVDKVEVGVEDAGLVSLRSKLRKPRAKSSDGSAGPDQASKSSESVLSAIPEQIEHGWMRRGIDTPGLVDPNLPATPRLTVLSDSTLLPEDSASQAGWRKLPGEMSMQRGMVPQQPFNSVAGTSEQGTRMVPIQTTLPLGPLRVTNLNLSAPTPSGTPLAADPAPAIAAAAESGNSRLGYSVTSPSSQASPPPPFTSSRIASPSQEDEEDGQKSPVASGIGGPLRVFWRSMKNLFGSKKLKQTALPTTTASAPPAPQSQIHQAAGEGNLLPPQTTIGTETFATSSSPSAKVVFSRLSHTFGRAHSGGSDEQSTAMTELSWPMAPFVNVGMRV